MKKLPIGIQTFSEIRKEDYLYVDKTGHALDLIESGKYYFLSRPRRFGKSLFISTLHAIFEGHQDLFQGLAIHDRWDWQTTYPVIKISFSGVARNVADMKQDINDILKSNQKRLGIECEDTKNIGGCFRELIEKSHEKYKQKVVILVDEYDKLILDNLDQIEMAKEAREILKDLYTTIKDCDEFIKFAFLTGVSKFAKVSIFSGLNNLKDITLDRRYSTICGYTQDDLDSVFRAHLKKANREKIRQWYNGYNFLGESVYNPFDILLFIDGDYVYRNYWFNTGTPTFIIKIIQRHNYFIPNLANLRVSENILNSFDIENIELEPVLFQAGYLTIKKVIELEFGGFEYHLALPNKEVTLSFNDIIIKYLTNSTQYTVTKSALFTALKNNDLELLQNTLTSLFAAIPYNNYVNNTISSYEGYFASVIYAYLASLGLDITAEDVTNKGRIDLTIKLEQHIYILEFKVDGDKSALQQIRDKGYHHKYLTDGRNIYLIGINFNSDKKNLAAFEWEKVK